MKKFLIRFFISCLLLLSLINNTFAFYSDVSVNNPYYNSIKTLYDQGKLSDEVDNQFHPESPLTKGDLYKMILDYAKTELSSSPSLPYSDISNDSIYAKYIQTAIDNKLIKAPSGKSSFGLNSKMTKFNTLNIIFNSLGIGISPLFPKKDFPFTDISPNSDAAAIAKKAADLKIFEPNKEKFLRNKKISKGEAADYLYKIKGESPTVTLTIQNLGTSTPPSNSFTTNKNFPTLIDVWSTLKKNYLYKDKLSDDQLIYGAIKGMVSEAKDKYTVFDSPSESPAFYSKLSNKYEGIGIVIELIEKDITVVAPIHDSPAEKAGIQGKDIIIKIDGQSVNGLSLEEVSAKIKGPANSSVQITVKRGNQEMDFKIVRKSINLKKVQTEILTSPSGKSIYHLSLSDFGDGSDDEFKEAAKEIIKNKPNGIIIDLRNNPGGYVDTAINIISLFTDQTKVAVKMEFVDKHIEEAKTNGDGSLKNYKVVILINEGSASASEIMAGALKDYGIATLVGKKSFGKGVAQEIRSYKDGSIFKYTVSNWLTPNGKNINGEGISPDITVEKGNDPNIDTQLNSALGQF